MTDDTKPNPDPTVLTTEALTRGLAAERDYVDGKVAVLGERLRGIDKATEVLNETVNRVPTDMQKEVAHLTSLFDEKFASVQTQFKERDTRQERESRDNKVAVDAALAAQKEAAAEQNKSNTLAIDKSETGVNEAIKKNAEQAALTAGALADKIDDLKERLSALDLKLGGLDTARSVGQELHVDRRGSTGTALNSLGLVVSVLALVAVVVIAVFR